jgi:ribosomal protein S1
MAWAKVGHPSEIVKVGDVVKVKVLRIDEETRKLSLGLRQLTDNPWDAAVAKLTPGTTIKGRVTKLADFGAFIEIEPGVEGLVHLSELAPHRVRRAGDVVKTGEEVEAVLLAIDLDARRISLSIRGALLAAQGKTEQVEALLAEATPAQPAPPKVNSANLRGGTGGAGPLIPNLFG